MIKHFQSEEPQYEGLHSKWKDGNEESSTKFSSDLDKKMEDTILAGLDAAIGLLEATQSNDEEYRFAQRAISKLEVLKKNKL